MLFFDEDESCCRVTDADTNHRKLREIASRYLGTTRTLTNTSSHSNHSGEASSSHDVVKLLDADQNNTQDRGDIAAGQEPSQNVSAASFIKEEEKEISETLQYIQAAEELWKVQQELRKTNFTIEVNLLTDLARAVMDPDILLERLNKLKAMTENMMKVANNKELICKRLEQNDHFDQELNVHVSYHREVVDLFQKMVIALNEIETYFSDVISFRTLDFEKTEQNLDEFRSSSKEWHSQLQQNIKLLQCYKLKLDAAVCKISTMNMGS